MRWLKKSLMARSWPTSSRPAACSRALTRACAAVRAAGPSRVAAARRRLASMPRAARGSRPAVAAIARPTPSSQRRRSARTRAMPGREPGVASAVVGSRSKGGTGRTGSHVNGGVKRLLAGFRRHGARLEPYPRCRGLRPALRDEAADIRAPCTTLSGKALRGPRRLVIVNFCQAPTSACAHKSRSPCRARSRPKAGSYTRAPLPTRARGRPLPAPGRDL